MPSAGAVSAPSGLTVAPVPGGVRPAPESGERPSRGGMEMPPTAQGSLSGRRVVVDPGHNGVYVGRIAERLVDAGNGRQKACNTSGTANSRMSEHELNWMVASGLAADLRGRGATVWMTRPDDVGVGPCVNERAAIGNRVGADLVVSIHADGNTSSAARGFHIITSTAMKGGAQSEARTQELARHVRDRMAATGMPTSTYLGRKGIDERTDIAGLNLSVPPAVMLEMGNMQHARDADLLADPRFRDATTRALADAVTDMLG